MKQARQHKGRLRHLWYPVYLYAKPALHGYDFRGGGTPRRSWNLISIEGWGRWVSWISRWGGLTIYSFATSKSMFSILSTSLRTLRAYRLKPIPGNHAGIYFTENKGNLSFKAERSQEGIERQKIDDSRTGKKSTAWEPGLPYWLVPVTAVSDNWTYLSSVELTRCP